MSIATNPVSLGNILNKILLGQLGSALNQMQLGVMLRQQMPITLRRCSPATAVTNPYLKAGQSVAETITGSSPAASPGANLLGQLPDDAKCNTILRATSIAGTGGLGSLIPDTQALNDTNFATGGSGPATTLHIGVSPSGDIVTKASDAWTSLDVVYIPEKCDVVEYPALSVVAATGICALPVTATTQGVVLLMEAQALAGTVNGTNIIITPGAISTTTKQCNLNTAKTQVQFVVADAVTSARVKVGLVSAVNQNQLLEAASIFI